MKIILKGQQIILKDLKQFAEGTNGILAFTAEKDILWQNFEVTLRFRHSADDIVYDLVDVEDGKRYSVPTEVLKPGTVYLSALGISSDGKIATTNVVCFTVADSLEGGMSPTVTPDAYAQYVELVKNERLLSQKAREETEKFLVLAEEYLQKTISHESAAGDAALFSENRRAACEELSASMANLKDQYTYSEALREAAEKQRQLAENERICAETLRQSGEAIRAEEEAARKVAEEERRSAEAARKASFDYALTSKADKPKNFIADNLLVGDKNGNLADSGMRFLISEKGSVSLIFDK